MNCGCFTTMFLVTLCDDFMTAKVDGKSGRSPERGET